jgi:hypothetical protein
VTGAVRRCAGRAGRAGAIVVIALWGVLVCHAVGYHVGGLVLDDGPATTPVHHGGDPHAGHHHGWSPQAWTHHHGHGSPGGASPAALDHGHLVPLWTGGAGALVAVAAAALLWAQRRRVLPRPAQGALVAVQGVVYLGLEVVERAAQGVAPTEALTDPRVVLGLALVPPVAVLLHRLTKLAVRGLEALVASRSDGSVPRSPDLGPTAVPTASRARRGLDWSFQARRGPPAPANARP